MLLKEVDFIQTRRKAKAKLREYRRWDRIAGRSLIDVRSPIITDMPKSDRIGNRAEDALLEHLEAESERNAILTALMALGLTSRQILYYTFCETESYSNYKIACELGYSERSIERKKKEALIEFAEAFKKGRLICYR